jgi:hypothetical protein
MFFSICTFSSILCVPHTINSSSISTTIFILLYLLQLTSSLSFSFQLPLFSFYLYHYHSLSFLFHFSFFLSFFFSLLSFFPRPQLHRSFSLSPPIDASKLSGGPAAAAAWISSCACDAERRLGQAAARRWQRVMAMRPNAVGRPLGGERRCRAKQMKSHNLNIVQSNK